MIILPKIFLIGFNRCGAKSLSSLFAHNDLKTIYWDKGRIAEDIAFAKQSASRPLDLWPDARVFSKLESIHRNYCPHLEGYKEFEFLRDWFPDAAFILNTRNMDDWLASRLVHEKSQFKHKQARLHGATVEQLPDIWTASWKQHHETCVEFFKSNSRFLRFDISADPLDRLIKFLAPICTISRIPETLNLDDLAQERVDFTNLIEEVDQTNAPFGYQKPTPDRRLDRSFNDKIIKFCTLNLSPGIGPVKPAMRSKQYAYWDGQNAVQVGDEQDKLMIRCDGLPDRQFLANPSHPKLVRTQVVLNEAISLGANQPIYLDMADGRHLGVDGMPQPSVPVLSYNRRAGAGNMCLWPLPRYHSPGNPYFARETPADLNLYEDKKDQVVWRGSLTGRPLLELGADPAYRGNNRLLLDNIQAAQTKGSCPPDELDWVVKNLNAVPRFYTLKHLQGNSDYNLGLVLPKQDQHFRQNPVFEGMCKERINNPTLFQYRYILSLSGSDTGSNFFTAINSNSVVFKEEDGWELFYTGCFSPWVHYIPIQRGGADIPQRLDWARANVQACKQMVTASQDVCRKIAKPNNRAAYLRGILKVYFANQ